MMSFLTAVATSRYPATNNQLRTSSNPRQQATINNGRVTIQPIQGRHNFMSASSSRPFTSGSGGALGKQRNYHSRSSEETSQSQHGEFMLEKAKISKHTKAFFRDDIIPFVKALKELFNSFDQYLIDEVTEVQNVFKQMELAVEQHRKEKHKFQNKMEHVLQENDQLLIQALSVEIVNVVVHDNVTSDCLNVDVCAHSLKEQLNKLKGKAVLTEAASLNPIDPELLKVDVAPLVPKLHKNRTAHTDYIRHTQEEAATLREIVESKRLLSPLNTSLDYA
nr:hypothetical protein [Tanacetum cinerariifolium]